MLDALVEVLNELVQGEDSRRMVQKILMSPHATFDDVEAMPEDLIVQAQEPIRVSTLGILNTALIRAGEPRRLVAVTDKDGLLMRLEAAPYPLPVPLPKPSPVVDECDHHWMEWRGHHDSENEGRIRCTRCSKFKGDL